MIKILGIALATAVVFSAPVMAQRGLTADQLNAQQLDAIRASNRIDAASVVTPAPAPVRAATTNTLSVRPFAGINVGSTLSENENFVLGGVVGVEVGNNVRVEAAYDYLWLDNETNAQTLMVNGILQQRFGAVTPYVLIGGGVGFDAYGTSSNAAEPLYNVGGGVRVNLTNNVELDARYRYLSSFDTDTTNRVETNIVTLGLGYRF